MGRDAGWLAAGAKLSMLNGNEPDLIYLPEVAFNLEEFLNKVKQIYDEKKKVLVCISEGIKDENNQYVINLTSQNNSSDAFGHTQLGGAASALTLIVKERLNLPVRAIELNLLQRCFSNLSSYSDILEAAKAGKYAVKQAIKKQTGKMVVMNRVSNNPYKLSYSLTNIDEIANKIKYFPKEWIINNCDISEEFITYALPLIDKIYHNKYENGLIKKASIDTIK